ncbi:hypothetical protein HUB94_16965 [Paenibacillus cellulosilyticus]|nr:hypothetical protein HUB94_16965 [Paenibacillus cellulosilyticus]
MRRILGITALVLALVMTSLGCSSLSKAKLGSSGNCNAEIEWVDFLMINDIDYNRNVDEDEKITPDQIGDKVGEVTYTASGHACTDYRMNNGDAAFLPIGTPIYAMKGYRSSFRVIADNKLYQARTNPNARSMAELLDIEGKVTKIGLDSGYDGSAIGDFTPEASEQFVQLLLPLAYVGNDETYKKSVNESGVFLRVYLKDGTSFRMVFYPNANAIGGAFGTEPLKTLIMAERQRIKSAAGL